MYYPAFLELTGRLCVVIGGGRVAERKIKTLLECGAKVKVISPEVTSGIERLYQEGKLTLEKRPYQEGDLEGAWLVIAATSDPEVQKQVFEEAESRRIFCNVVDVPERCSFIVPSVIRRGELCLAISTSGASPALARRIRERLEKEFDSSWEQHLRLMRHIRKEVLSSGLSPQEREVKLKRLAMVPFYSYLRRKEYALIRSILKSEGLTFPSWLSQVPKTSSTEP
jgi:precorrin-2 dehydrogenase/sirohydrochlorin ferrochelatase